MEGEAVQPAPVVPEAAPAQPEGGEYLSQEGHSSAPAAAPQTPDLLSSILPILVIWGVFFYLFFIRPDRKKKHEHQSMLDTMKTGDKAVTAGGIHGTVTKTGEETVTLKVDDKTGACITFSRAAIIRIDGKDAKAEKKD